MRHDPSAICAHLNPVIDDLKRNVEGLHAVHFVSDGPVTQYRNKNMFQLWVIHLARQLGVHEMTWNYTEAGHGKGAPDGVGGSVKRLADTFVARSFDIPNLDKLISLLETINSNTKFYVIDREEIETMDKIILKTIPPFKGTLLIHQLTWNRAVPSFIQARSLSCSSCDTMDTCEHYGIGRIKIYNPLGILYRNLFNDLPFIKYQQLIY